MLAILMSIHSKHIINIFDEEKLREIRKKFPIDYRGWIYIYCCQDETPVYIPWEFEVEKQEDGTYKALTDFERGNGKVVARFWCDGVDNINVVFEKYCAGDLSQEGLLDYSCLSFDELHDYLNGYSGARKIGKSIHITKLEIFDKPKPLSDFMPRKWDKCGVKDKNGLYQCHKCPHAIHYGHGFGDCGYAPLKRPPQSWQYIEVK